MRTFSLTVSVPNDRVKGIYKINVFTLKDGKRRVIYFNQCKAKGFVDALRLAQTRLTDALEYD